MVRHRGTRGTGVREAREKALLQDTCLGWVCVCTCPMLCKMSFVRKNGILKQNAVIFDSKTLGVILGVGSLEGEGNVITV